MFVCVRFPLFGTSPGANKKDVYFKGFWFYKPKYKEKNLKFLLGIL